MAANNNPYCQLLRFGLLHISHGAPMLCISHGAPVNMYPVNMKKNELSMVQKLEKHLTKLKLNEATSFMAFFCQTYSYFSSSIDRKVKLNDYSSNSSCQIESLGLMDETRCMLHRIKEKPLVALAIALHCMMVTKPQFASYGNVDLTTGTAEKNIRNHILYILQKMERRHPIQILRTIIFLHLVSFHWFELGNLWKAVYSDCSDDEYLEFKKTMLQILHKIRSGWFEIGLERTDGYTQSNLASQTFFGLVYLRTFTLNIDSTHKNSESPESPQNVLAEISKITFMLIARLLHTIPSIECTEECYQVYCANIKSEMKKGHLALDAPVAGTVLEDKMRKKSSVTGVISEDCCSCGKLLENELDIVIMDQCHHHLCISCGEERFYDDETCWERYCPRADCMTPVKHWTIKRLFDRYRTQNGIQESTTQVEIVDEYLASLKRDERTPLREYCDRIKITLTSFIDEPVNLNENCSTSSTCKVVDSNALVEIGTVLRPKEQPLLAFAVAIHCLMETEAVFGSHININLTKATAEKTIRYHIMSILQKIEEAEPIQILRTITFLCKFSFQWVGNGLRNFWRSVYSNCNGDEYSQIKMIISRIVRRIRTQWFRIGLNRTDEENQSKHFSQTFEGVDCLWIFLSEMQSIHKNSESFDYEMKNEVQEIYKMTFLLSARVIHTIPKMECTWGYYTEVLPFIKEEMKNGFLALDEPVPLYGSTWDLMKKNWAGIFMEGFECCSCGKLLNYDLDIVILDGCYYNMCLLCTEDKFTDKARKNRLCPKEGCLKPVENWTTKHHYDWYRKQAGIMDYDNVTDRQNHVRKLCVKTDLVDYTFGYRQKIASYLLNHTYKNWQTIFCDGSRSKDGVEVGSAAVMGNIKKLKKLSPGSSSNNAELCALRLAAEIVSEESQISQNREYVIFSDSLNNVRKCNTLEQRSEPEFMAIRDILLPLILEGFSIDICWIPAHSGIEGNLEADEAARQAARQVCPS